MMPFYKQQLKLRLMPPVNSSNSSNSSRKMRLSKRINLNLSQWKKWSNVKRKGIRRLPRKKPLWGCMRNVAQNLKQERLWRLSKWQRHPHLSLFKSKLSFQEPNPRITKDHWRDLKLMELLLEEEEDTTTLMIVSLIWIGFQIASCLSSNQTWRICNSKLFRRWILFLRALWPQSSRTTSLLSKIWSSQEASWAVVGRILMITKSRACKWEEMKTSSMRARLLKISFQVKLLLLAAQPYFLFLVKLLLELPKSKIKMLKTRCHLSH